MITKEKHFTKCETPNSSRIVEDKKPPTRISNGIATMDPAKAAIKCNEPVKQEKLDENKIPLLDKPNSITDDKTENSDDNILYNAPKFGTVIPNRIFVGGFSAKTADEELWRFFSSFSHITAAKIIYDRAGVSKCYGFVTFANPKDAKAIVKQYGGVMFSPMGRLRIAQAVRKQAPQFSPELSPVMGVEPYYLPLPPQGPHKGPLCITAYPMQPQAPMQPQQATMNTQPMLRRESPRGSAATTPETSLAAAPPQQAQAVPAPRFPRAPALYHQGQAMVAPQYMLYPQSMPGYDATGLYTTCPGYAAAPSMPGAYPYVMLHPRDFSPVQYHPHHPQQLTQAPLYHPAPPQPTPCYLPPHQEVHNKMPMPLINMNSYIY